MSEIDRIVSGSITADTTTTPREGFGVQIAMSYHTKNPDLFRDYGDLPSLTTDGFATFDPAYRMAAAAFSQNPRPTSIRIGRMTTSVHHTVKLTCTDATVGKTTSVTITDAAGVAHVISHTNAGGDTTSTIATAIGALIAAISGVTGAVVTTNAIVVTITALGAVWYYDSLSCMAYLDQTPDASIDADLTACLLADSGFYGVSIALISNANHAKVDAWAEANKKMYFGQTADSEEAATGTSVFGAAIDAANYTHTLGMYHSKPRQYMSSAWLGRMLPLDAGSATAALKQLANVDTDSLTATQINALDANSLNYYIKAGSRGVTRKDGTVGSGEKFDIIIGEDWLNNEIQTSVFDFIASQEDKVNYDDGGIASIESIIRGCLKLGVQRNFLEAGNGDDIPKPTVQPMKVTDQATADRAARILRGVKFSANFAGAIHAVTYAGTLSL